MVSSIAGLCVVRKLRAKLSLDLLYAEDEEDTWAVLFCMTEKGSWNVYVTEEPLSKDTDTSGGERGKKQIC